MGAELDELPATVEALLIAQIDTLMPADRRLLRRAAVLGQRFPLSWLSGMLDMPEDELQQGLARLRDFLEVEPGRVRFQHALQRQAAYEALPFERRRACADRRRGRLTQAQWRPRRYTTTPLPCASVPAETWHGGSSLTSWQRGGAGRRN